MATTDILGLFTSPEQYQRQQDLVMQRQAAELAQLDPYQNIRFGAIRAGQQFGRGLAGILGAEDPQLRMITARQSALRGINLAEPDSIFNAARQLADAGDQQGALMLADYGRKAQADKALSEQRTRERMSPALQAAKRIRELTEAKQKLISEGATEDASEIQLINAEVESLRRGVKAAGADMTDAQKNARALALLKGEEGTAEYNTEYAKQLPLMLSKGGPEASKEINLANNIVDIEKQIREAADPNAPEVMDLKSKASILRSQLKGNRPNLTVIGEAKSGPDKGKAVLVDEVNDQQFIYDIDKNGKQYRKPFTGDVDRVTSSVTSTTNVLPSGPKQVVEGIGKLDVEDVKIARENKRAAVASNIALQKLTTLDNRGLISGAFAPSRVGAANFLNTLGLLSANDASQLATSEQYQKVGSDLVFQSLQGKLGTGISNADRDFIEKIFPRLENSAEARRELIQYITKKNNAIIEEANDVEDYLRKNNTLSGYKPKISGIYTPSSSPVSRMTDQQLRDAFNEFKKKGK